MSIAISVESFSYLPDTEPFQSETSVRKAYVARRADLLQQICLHFGWRNAPWDELHTRTTPESDSLMWSTYDTLYSLAQSVAYENKTSVFMHFLTRYDDGQLVIYLPVVFDKPFLVERSVYPEKTTVASSWWLMHELEELTTYLSTQGSIVTDATQPTRYAHRLLCDFAKSSWVSQLPLFLSW